MPAKKYHVTLTEEQRQQTEIIARSYKHSAYERNRAERTVHWQFTTQDARIKLKKLYPKILP